MQCIFVQQTGITKSSKAWLFHHKFIDKNDEKIVKNGRNMFSGQMIPDNHEKMILSMDHDFNNSYDGIKSLNLIDLPSSLCVPIKTSTLPCSSRFRISFCFVGVTKREIISTLTGYASSRFSVV